MTIRFKPGDNVELEPNTFHSKAVDAILARSGLLPLEIGEGFKNDLTIIGFPGIANYDYMASIKIARLLPYIHTQQCDIYVNDNELNPAPATISAKWSSGNNTAQQLKFKPGDKVKFNSKYGMPFIDAILSRTNLSPLQVGEGINEATVNGVTGQGRRYDYVVIVVIDRLRTSPHTSSLQKDVVYVCENEIDLINTPSINTVANGVNAVPCNNTAKDNSGVEHVKADFTMPCTHPCKYLNVISAGLKFWCCPDCKKEIE